MIMIFLIDDLSCHSLASSAWTTMDLENAQESFVHFLGELHPDSKIGFLDWVCKEYSPHALESDSSSLPEEDTQDSDILESIASDIRTILPLNALAPEEPQLLTEKEGQTASNTLHIDSFLYPQDEDIDKLCLQMDISRNYCLTCGSWKTAPLNLISHSMSHDQIQFIFGDLLPNLTGKCVVDVGSRLGAVIYGGFQLSKATHLVGIEKSQFFCELQERVVIKYNMADRVKVVCSDVLHQSQLLACADVVILNNVFEMFCSLEEQVRIWEFLFTHIRKKGTLLVTVPSIAECWKDLPFETMVDLHSWVVEVSTGVDKNDEELRNIHFYCVV